ncbi:MAG: hypothetical protein C0616_00195 [Desulfuromonas sp.]|nr:MAG: hypothetical protein C0616_00195 [Desulfuromonas sp.]
MVRRHIRLIPFEPVRHSLIVSFFCLCCLTAGCGGLSKNGNGADDLPSRLFVDANLGINLEIPQEWQRAMSTPMWESPASYAVAWQGYPAETFGDIRIRLTILEPRETQFDVEPLLQLYRQRFPTFQVTAQKPVERPTGDAIEILGYTPADNRRLLFLPLKADLGLLECIASAANFSSFQPIFDEIQASLHPIE